MDLYCQNCGAFFRHPKYYRRLCIECGGDDPPRPWFYLSAMCVGVVLGMIWWLV